MINSSVILITALGTAIGIIIWLILFHRDKVADIAPKQLFIIIISVGILCRVVFLICTPVFYAPDEQAHFKYINYLSENHSLPFQTSKTGSPTNDWEYYQPPLYYLSLTPFYLLFKSLSLNTEITVRLLRLFSIVFFGIAILFSFKLLNYMKINDLFSKTFVISMFSLLPAYTFISSVINNDNMVIVLGAGILYLMVRSRTILNAIGLGFMLGLGLLTKLTAVEFFIIIAAMTLIQFANKKYFNWSMVFHSILSISTGLIIWLPWAWRNWTIYGSITAEEIANTRVEWKSVYHAIWGLGNGLQNSFWAVSGIYNNISFQYPIIGKHIFYLAIAGLIYGMVFKNKKLIYLKGSNTFFLISSFAAIGLSLLLLIRFGWLYGQAQGRFLFPLLIPISLILAGGLQMFPIFNTRKAHIHVAGLFIVYSISFLFFSIAMFIR